MKNHHITKLKGFDDRVYLTVGKVAMSVEGRHYFDNYPVVTTEEHTWYLLETDGKLCAFVAVLFLKGVYAIRNLYIAPDCPHAPTFNVILKPVIKEFNDSTYDIASAYCKASDTKHWQKLGFEVISNGGNWHSLHKKK